MKSHKEALSYRPDIDGLRALAVLPVILFHAGLGCQGGFIGVDIFFVISGFLITSIIQKQLLRGDFKMSHFWEKRIRRIFPALIVVIVFTIAAASFFYYPKSYEAFGKELISQSLIGSNFYFWQQDGYFAGPSEYQSLLHTWSLAVEEQFYIFFPLLLTFLYSRKNASTKNTLSILAVLFTASLAWSCYGVYRYPQASFFLLPARAWELILGACLALYHPQQKWSQKWNELLSWLALATIAYCIYAYDSALAFPGAAALPPCLAAGILIHCNRRKLTTPGKILSLKPFVFIGKISYSFYLWHWPIIVFANYSSVEPLSINIRIGLFALSFLFAYLSWKFVETPFRTNTTISKKKVFYAFYASTALFIIAGTVIYKGDGWKQRFSDDVSRLALAGDVRFELQKNAKLQKKNQLLKTGKLATIPIDTPEATLAPIMLWGDSHATSLVPTFEKLCLEHNIRVYVANKGGSPPILKTVRKKHADMADYNDAVYKFIKEKKIKDVVLAARWAYYPLGEAHTQTIATLQDIQDPELTPQEVFTQRLPFTVQKLAEVGVRVWIVKQVPLQEIDPPRALANAYRFGGSHEQLGVHLDTHKEWQSLTDSVIDSLNSPRVTILDPTSYFASPTGTCIISANGETLYRDRNHLSIAGALRLVPLFKPVIESHNTSTADE